MKGEREADIDWCESNIDTLLERSSWIDGFTSLVKVRARAIDDLMLFLRKHHGTWDGYWSMLMLLTRLKDAIDCPTPDPDQQELLDRFVCERERERLPVVWYDTVRPTRVDRFLIHILLSMGHFVDEYDLFAVPTLRHAFVKARLLDLDNPRLSAISLVREYILSQHVALPCGTRTFDRYLVAAYNSVIDLFVHGSLHSDEVPTALYCRLKTNTENDIVTYMNDSSVALVKFITTTLKEAGLPGIPDPSDVMAATFTAPCAWDPASLPCAPDQPVESHSEQRKLIELSKHLVSHYKSCASEFTKGLCQVGAGGVGKTTLLLIELLYAMCQGLNTTITAMLSERAQELCGNHIHDMFGFHVNDRLSPGQMAERACSALYQKPKKLEFLRTIDVLGLDEAGAVPCEVLSAMCTVLRYIRNSNRPFGGMLIFATMDYLQLPPVSGRHPLLSPFFTSCFFFRELVESVRAALDDDFKEIQRISRLHTEDLASPETRSRFVELFKTTFSFVRDLDDPSLPRSKLFVFGKKAPIREREKYMLDQLRDQPDLVYRISTAIDEERTIDGNFRAASSITSNCLDGKVKEPRNLVLYAGGRYQITYNKPDNFSNSQLAMLFTLPTQRQLDSKLPIEMIVAPPGCRFIPDERVSKQKLLADGWTKQMIGFPRRREVQNAAGSIRARRRQYGLRHHIGSTIHGIMGQTLQALITRIERGDKTKPYALWTAAQVIVLLSRTKKGKDTFFWLFKNTEPEDVADILYDVLQTTSPFRVHLTKLLRQLCSDGGEDSLYPYTIDHTIGIMRPRDVPLPTDQQGYVYLIVSTRDFSTTYIGSAFDLNDRWRRHNNGIAAKQMTPIRLRPWAILAYIAGFDGNESKFRSVEREWIALKQDMQRNPNVQLTVQSIHNAGKDVVAMHNRRTGDLLRFVSCGTIERVQQRELDDLDRE